VLPIVTVVAVTPGALAADEEDEPPPPLPHAAMESAVIAEMAVIARSLVERVIPFASH
jgi:hypothetical protein